MAEQLNLFQRLRKLFANDIIVRHVGGKKLKVVDTDSLQSTLSNMYRDRYSRIYSVNGMGNTWGNQYGMNMSYHTQRISLFKEYDIMDQDPIINAALDIYAQESTVKDEFGDILTIESDDGNIKDILHNLFYDILNIEFNLNPWIRNMCKYGDQFLFLEISDGYGIVNVQPLSVYDVMRIEGDDPDNPRYTYFQTMTMSGRTERLEEYEVCHFRLQKDANFLPYGRAAIEGARRTWKQLTLIEDAMLIHQIMRAPEKRLIKLDIGSIPPAEIEAHMARIADKMKKVPFIDQETGDYNLRYNMMNILEDYVIPVRDKNSGTTIENLGGLEFATSTELVEYIKHKMMAALKIPKAFLGYDETVNGKVTLAAEDVRFARSIEDVQNIVVHALNKIAVVHLYSQGYTDADLINFKLTLTLSSTIYEQEKINLWKEKIQLISDAKLTQLISEDWMYKNILKMSEDESEKQRRGVAEDVKRRFRYMQLEQGAPDPAKYGFPQDAPPTPTDGMDGMEGDGGAADGQEPMGEGRMGRPKKGQTYGQDSHPRGRDPLGEKGQYDVMRHSGSRTRKPDKNNYSLAREGVVPNSDDLDENTLLDENLLYGPEEYTDVGLLFENNIDIDLK